MTARITFRVPAQSGRGNGPFSVDHIDVFAMTMAPGMVVPPNRLAVIEWVSYDLEPL